MAEKKVGTVTHYYPKAHAAIVHVDKGTIHIGDTIHVVGNRDDVTAKVKRIEIEHEPVNEARKGQSVGVQIDTPVHEKAEVYLVQ